MVRAVLRSVLVLMVIGGAAIAGNAPRAARVSSTKSSSHAAIDAHAAKAKPHKAKHAAPKAQHRKPARKAKSSHKP